VEKSHPLRSSR